MKSRTEIIVEQLGMSQGTAMNRLRKMILFSLIQEVKRDLCFVCDKKIHTVQELSIEHKEPWEGRSAELFWSLDNIAFSHLRCNKPHTIQLGKSNLLKRKVGPKGTAWCAFHEKFEPTENFWPHNQRWNGFRPNCKTGRYGRGQIKVPRGVAGNGS